jgi:hypothetical protein
LKANFRHTNSKASNEELAANSGALDALEELQSHTNDKVYSLSYKILTENFDIE